MNYLRVGTEGINQTALTFSFNETAYNNQESSALFKGVEMEIDKIKTAMSEVKSLIESCEDEVVRLELIESYEAMQYALWTLNNALAIKRRDLSKSVYRRWPEFYFVAGAEELRKHLQLFGYPESEEFRRTSERQAPQN